MVIVPQVTTLNRMIVVVMEIDTEHQVIKGHGCRHAIHRIPHHRVITTIVVDGNRRTLIPTGAGSLAVRCLNLTLQSTVLCFELPDLLPILTSRCALLAPRGSRASIGCGCCFRTARRRLFLACCRAGTRASASRCAASAISATRAACRPSR